MFPHAAIIFIFVDPICVIIIGAIILPINIPNLNQILFKGVNSFEFINPNTKKIKDTIKDQYLIVSPLNNGHKAIIKNIKKKTIPKFLFVGSFIF